MNNEAKIQEFWKNYRQALLDDNIPPKQAEWYIRAVQKYVDANKNLPLKEHVQEDLIAYLSRLLKKYNFDEWQYAQIVDALRILFQKFVRPEWATTFHWEKRKEPHLNFPEKLVQYGDNDETWLPVVDRDNFRDSLKGLKSMELFEKYFTKLHEEVRKKHEALRVTSSHFTFGFLDLPRFN